MKITIDITDKKQIQQFEALRGDMPAQEFAGLCFAQGLKLAKFQRQQQAAAREIGRHPLLQFPETRAEFRATEHAALQAALKENNKADPIVIEINRLVGAYMAQLGSFAAQNGNRLPSAMQIEAATPIQRAALQITLATVKNALEKQKKAA